VIKLNAASVADATRRRSHGHRQGTWA